MSRVGVVGGGPAGMMAAIRAAEDGHEVHLFEKNEKLGKKLFITGKGRCNLTNACEIEELFNGILSNHSFLYSSFYHFSNIDVMTFFKECGVPLKVERGNRVFPESDLSSDIIMALEKKLKELPVKVYLNTEVKEILVEVGNATLIKGLRYSYNREMDLDSCIIATGGLTYPSTGSTGDGYYFAETLGHKVSKLYPGLVPIEVKEEDVKKMQGLSLRNIKIKIFPLINEEDFVYDKRKLLYEEFGEMLLTHFGVSGPVILSAGSIIGGELKKKNLALILDLKPALSFEQLDSRVLREISENPNRQFKNGIKKLFPAILTPVMIKRSGINPEKQMNSLTKEERHHFVNTIKNFTMILTGLRPMKEGIITKGGVSVKEINPQTMESKLVRNLHFAGEVLDVDGITGGFNLQIAWSTGALAGSSII
jgi:predicted Rossmann fold flavoprotein